MAARKKDPKRRTITRKRQATSHPTSHAEPAPKSFFNCDKCPSYCCSYELIEVTDADLARLAKHFELTVPEAEKTLTHLVEGQRSLRHQKDVHYGTICQFLDLQTRRCTVYGSRPLICREFPGTARCGYYDFLMSERRSQEDPEFVSRAYNPPAPS